MGYRIGVDVGGSFTDFAVFDDGTGALSTLKVFSRPDAPGEEILLALDTLKSATASKRRTSPISPMAPPSASTPSSSATARTSRCSPPKISRTCWALHA
nr:hydantoinase/oxoprolinase N-terminal domain-containing protein [Agrobacterium tumefaciens]